MLKRKQRGKECRICDGRGRKPAAWTATGAVARWTKCWWCGGCGRDPRPDWPQRRRR